MNRPTTHHLLEIKHDEARLLCGSDIETAWVRGCTFTPVKKVTSALLASESICRECLEAAVEAHLLPAA